MAFFRNLVSKLLGNNPSSNEQHAGSQQKETEPLITMTEDEIICSYPSQHKTDKISWKNINNVDVLTTDEGPAVCDVFILIRDNNGGVAIPQEKEECKLILDRIFKLHEFDFAEFTKAMGSAENKIFNVWKKK